MPTRQDRAWADYSERFRARVMPQLLSSRVFLALYEQGSGGAQEVQFATSLGMMLLYEKPIVLVARPGVRIPLKLRRVADVVIDEAEPSDPETQERLLAAFKQLGVT